MNDIKVSIIVPVYNAEKYLHECIQSILRQSFRGIELILVDDGSKDSSLSICKQYVNTSDIIVKVIHQENSGSSITRKNGVLAACGKYIGFIDADDYIDDKMYERMITEAEKDNADMVICGISYLRGEKIFPLYSKIEAGEYTSDRLEALKNTACMDGMKDASVIISPSLCNKIIKRELLLKHFQDISGRLTMGEDWIVSYPCLWDSNKVIILNDCYYVYRYNTTGMTKAYNTCMWQDTKRLFDITMAMKKKYGYEMDDYYHYYFRYIILLCIINETRSNNHFFSMRKKLKHELAGEVCTYAFGGFINRYPSRILNIISFLISHNAFSILSIFLIFKRKIS